MIGDPPPLGQAAPDAAPDTAAAGTNGADPAPMLDQLFDSGSLYSVRAAVEAHVTQAGMPQGRTDDMVIAIHELVSNAVRHGAGAGRLRIWHQGGELRCHIEDDGPEHPDGADDAGNVADLWPYQHGHGLWLVRHMADRMSLHSDHQGTRATVGFTLPAPDRPPFSLARQTRDDCVVIGVTGDLDRGTAPELTSAVAALLSASRLRLVLDLTGQTFWDSSGIAALITIQRRVEDHPSAAMALAGLPGPLRRHLDRLELTGRFTISGTTDQAVQTFAARD